MGRDLKRVPLDFQWPQRKTWKGYINPYADQAIDCPHCEMGYSPEALRIHKLWYGQLPFKPEDNGSTPFTHVTPEVRAFAKRNVLSATWFYGEGHVAIIQEAKRLAELWNGRLSHHLNQAQVDFALSTEKPNRYTHDFVSGTGWVEKTDPHHPTAEEFNRNSILDHGSGPLGAVIEYECDRLGVPTTCTHCHGETCTWPSEEVKKAYEEWERSEPPEGEGYQIWENVSDGSPISPVFATPLALAEYMNTHPYGGDDGTTVEQWLKFINGPGWAPTGVAYNGKVMTGVAYNGKVMTGVQALSVDE